MRCEPLKCLCVRSYIFHVGHIYLFMWMTCTVYFHILHINYWQMNACWVFSPNNFQTFAFGFCDRQSMMLASLWSSRLSCPSHRSHGRTRQGMLHTQVLQSILPVNRNMHTPFWMVSWMVAATLLIIIPLVVITRIKVAELGTYSLYDIITCI